MRGRDTTLQTYNSAYRYGYNGKEQDKSITSQDYDYGMRIYDARVGRFLSVDPLQKQYPFYSPYHFAGNMPIAAIDLDGKEVKVSFGYMAVSKDRSEIEISSSVSIKVQIINLSSTSNSHIDLQNIALNLQSDLSNKLSGSNTAIMNLPFLFKSNGNKITEVETAKTKDDFKNYAVTYKTNVFADVSVANDITKINKDAWVFAIVDDINDLKTQDVSGLADAAGGKVAIGEADNFSSEKTNVQGRQLALHETLHLLGATDTYQGSGLSGTQNSNNVMYYLDPNNKRQLTPEQIVTEIFTSTIGGVGELKNLPYKQPINPNSNTPTQQQLKTFIKDNTNASQLQSNQSQ